MELGHQVKKIGQIFKLPYLRQFLSWNVDQKLKMQECSWLSG